MANFGTANEQSERSCCSIAKVSNSQKKTTTSSSSSSYRIRDRSLRTAKRETLVAVFCVEDNVAGNDDEEVVEEEEEEALKKLIAFFAGRLVFPERRGGDKTLPSAL